MDDGQAVNPASRSEVEPELGIGGQTMVIAATRFEVDGDRLRGLDVGSPSLRSDDLDSFRLGPELQRDGPMARGAPGRALGAPRSVGA